MKSRSLWKLEAPRPEIIQSMSYRNLGTADTPNHTKISTLHNRLPKKERGKYQSSKIL